MVSAYPPEPWRLVGDLYAAVVPVRRDAVAGLVPDDHHLITVAGWSVAVVAWAAYRPGGMLSYSELALTLPVRRRWRLRATVPRIWVDSPASRDGGRVLWAIPKELASFELRAGSGDAVVDGGRLAECSFRSLARLPGRWPVRFWLAQPDVGGSRLVAVRGRGTVEVGLAAVHVHADGPFAELARPLSVPAAALRGFVLVFGKQRWRRGPRRR